MSMVSATQSVSSQNIFVLKARSQGLLTTLEEGDPGSILERYNGIKLGTTCNDYYFRLQRLNSEAYPSFIEAEHTQVAFSDQANNLRNIYRQVKFLQRYRLNERVRDYVKDYLPRCMNYRKMITSNPTREDKRIFRSASQVIARTVRSVDTWQTSEDAIAGLQRVMKLFKDTMASDLDTFVSELEVVRKKLGEEEVAAREALEEQEVAESSFSYTTTNDDLYDYLVEGKRLAALDNELFTTFTEHYFNIYQRMKQFFLSISRGDYGHDLKEDFDSCISREKLLVYCLFDIFKNDSVKKAFRTDPGAMHERDRTVYDHLLGRNEMRFMTRSSSNQTQTADLEESIYNFFDESVTPSLKEVDDGGEEVVPGFTSRYYDVSKFEKAKKRIIRAYLKDETESLSASEQTLLRNIEAMVGRVHFYDVDVVVSRDCEKSPKADFDSLVFGQDEAYKLFEPAQKESKIIATVLKKASKEYIASDSNLLKRAEEEFIEISKENYTEEKDEKLGKIFRYIWSLGFEKSAWALLANLEDNGGYNFLTQIKNICLQTGLYQPLCEMVKYFRSPYQKTSFLSDLVFREHFRNTDLNRYLELLEVNHSFFSKNCKTEDFNRVGFCLLGAPLAKVLELSKENQARFVRVCILFGRDVKIVEYFKEKHTTTTEAEGTRVLDRKSYEKELADVVEATLSDRKRINYRMLFALARIVKSHEALQSQFLAKFLEILYENLDREGVAHNTKELLVLGYKNSNFTKSQNLLHLPVQLLCFLQKYKDEAVVRKYLDDMVVRVNQTIFASDSPAGLAILNVFPMLANLLKEEEFVQAMKDDNSVDKIGAYKPKPEHREAFHFYVSWYYLKIAKGEKEMSFSVSTAAKITTKPLKDFLYAEFDRRNIAYA